MSPNNDTLYSVAWLDLRAQPVVLCTPDVPRYRYYSVQLVDGYTHNIAILSPRTAGSWEAARYLIAGPNWSGCIPAELRDIRVYQAESEFVFALGRTRIYGADDLDNVRRVQSGYDIKLLSALIGNECQPQPPDIFFPPLMPGRPIETESFFACANFILQFLKIDEDERQMFKRFELIGVGPGNEFDLQSDVLSPYRDDICSGASKAYDEIDAFSTPKSNGWSVNTGPPTFGTREVMRGRYKTRAAAAHVALYGLDPHEAVYYISEADVDGDPLDGSRHSYALRFAAGQLPSLSPGGFWSLTMYHLPKRLLVCNPIGRYSVGDKTQGVRYGADGSLALFLQSQSPTSPEELANWLPAPSPPQYTGRFAVIFRVYWPDDPVFYVPPAIAKVCGRGSKL